MFLVLYLLTTLSVQSSGAAVFNGTGIFVYSYKLTYINSGIQVAYRPENLFKYSPGGDVRTAKIKYAQAFNLFTVVSTRKRNSDTYMMNYTSTGQYFYFTSYDDLNTGRYISFEVNLYDRAGDHIYRDSRTFYVDNVSNCQLDVPGSDCRCQQYCSERLNTLATKSTGQSSSGNRLVTTTSAYNFKFSSGKSENVKPWAIAVIVAAVILVIAVVVVVTVVFIRRRKSQNKQTSSTNRPAITARYAANGPLNFTVNTPRRPPARPPQPPKIISAEKQQQQYQHHQNLPQQRNELKPYVQHPANSGSCSQYTGYPTQPYNYVYDHRPNRRKPPAPPNGPPIAPKPPTKHGPPILHEPPNAHGPSSSHRYDDRAVIDSMYVGPEASAPEDPDDRSE